MVAPCVILAFDTTFLIPTISLVGVLLTGAVVIAVEQGQAHPGRIARTKHGQGETLSFRELPVLTFSYGSTVGSVVEVLGGGFWGRGHGGKHTAEGARRKWFWAMPSARALRGFGPSDRLTPLLRSLPQGNATIDPVYA